MIIDIYEAFELSNKQLDDIHYLPTTHHSALTAYVKVLAPSESDSYRTFYSEMLAVSTTVQAMLSSLSRPHALISSLQASQKAAERQRSSLKRSDRWPLGLMEESRRQAALETQDRLTRSIEDVRITGCELRYTQQTVAAELAGWQDLQGKMIRRAVRRLAKNTIVRERDRLDSLHRALRLAREV